MQKLLDIMEALRDPVTGCPWDREQDFRSVAPYTIEEAYEVADAIDREDLEDLKGELGDLLLQVVFHAQMASEKGIFNFSDVVSAISEKMVRRHPHVFEDVQFDTPQQRRMAWDTEKRRERAARQADDPSALAGIAQAIPALSRAEKLGRRAASAGFDWPDVSGVLEKIIEEANELSEACSQRDQADIEEEFGDLLFSMVNLARHLELDPEESLRRANRKFESRFRRLEDHALAGNRDLKTLSISELELIWQQIK